MPRQVGSEDIVGEELAGFIVGSDVVEDDIIVGADVTAAVGGCSGDAVGASDTVAQYPHETSQ